MGAKKQEEIELMRRYGALVIGRNLDIYTAPPRIASVFAQRHGPYWFYAFTSDTAQTSINAYCNSSIVQNMCEATVSIPLFAVLIMCRNRHKFDITPVQRLTEGIRLLRLAKSSYGEPMTANLDLEQRV